MEDRILFHEWLKEIIIIHVYELRNPLYTYVNKNIKSNFT